VRRYQVAHPPKLGVDLLQGDLRLLHDLTVLQLAMAGNRPPVEERLEQSLGADFARVVRSSLAATAVKAA
jgi:hypothetical protein